MPIIKEPFGNTLEGLAVERYHLINGKGHRVCILTYGGIIQALETPDMHGHAVDVVLGFDILEPYLAAHPYFGAIIGRYANRIGYGRFKLTGKHYQLATNDGSHHLHGGLRGFDKHVWQAEVREMTNASCLVLSHTSMDGEEGYPGTLKVEVCYTWSDNHALRIDYKAITDAPTILNLTNHSYFNLAGVAEQTHILEHRLQIYADRYLPVNATLIPNGEQAKVEGSCMDFRHAVGIGQHMDVTHAQIRYANGGYDHAWILNADKRQVESENALPMAAIVSEPSSGRTMKVYSSQPAMQCYTGNFLDGSLVGKGNWRYVKHAGFCLETQHYPDAPNQPQFPSTVLLPGAIYQQSTIYEFSVT